jgi:hypothetical protein
MNIQQTLFDDLGQPLGKALTDTMTGETRFIPCGADEPLPDCWTSIADCRAAVLVTVEREWEAAS